MLDAKPVITIDDGMDLIHYIHTQRRDLIRKVIGGCEETTTGIHRLRSMAADGKLEFPVIAVNDTPMKRFFDNVHGTGESALSSIMITTNTLVAGKYFVVAGYGFCGRGLAQKAHGLGAKVIVTEIDPRRALEAHMDGFMVMSMDEAALIGDIFVTTTGNVGVIAAKHFKKLKNGAILANAGHFNVEIDIGWLQENADRVVQRDGIETFMLKKKAIHVLAEGRLVNLATPKGMGHPVEVMDLSFALQALCARHIVIHGKKMKGGVYEVPQEIDEPPSRSRRSGSPSIRSPKSRRCTAAAGISGHKKRIPGSVFYFPDPVFMGWMQYECSHYQGCFGEHRGSTVFLTLVPVIDPPPGTPRGNCQTARS